MEELRRAHPLPELPHLGVDGLAATEASASSFREIPADAETAPSARQDHHPRVVIRGGALDSGERLRQHVSAHGIQTIRSIEGDRGDSVFCFVENVRHSFSYGIQGSSRRSS